MPTISGLATTFNLPQYGGELIQLSPTDTPFFSAIGGLALQDEDLLVASTQFFWQTEDLPAAAQPAIVEGANPIVTEQARSSGSNVVQIFQYGVSVSYSQLGANQQLANVGTGQRNPVSDELTHQIMLKIPTAKRDINYSFLNGAYQLPADNATGRKTRGLLSAITTNVTAAAGAALTETMVLDQLQTVYQARGIRQDWEPTIIVGATQKRKLSTIFITDKNYQERSRTIAGVNVQEIETDFGRINIMLERVMPAATLAFAHLRPCRPRFMLIPSKGFLFVEPLAKTGAAENYQLYGEVGLEYGDESLHAKISGLATA
jgi:hypothetical protein